MEERLAFVRAVCATPADDAPRLVYADWLDEKVEEGACPKCGGAGVRKTAWHDADSPFVCVHYRDAGPAGSRHDNPADGWVVVQQQQQVSPLLKSRRAAKAWAEANLGAGEWHEPNGSRAPYHLMYATKSRCLACRGTGHIPNGHRERAELIRVQIELARLSAAALKRGQRTGGPPCRHRFPAKCALCRDLRGREQELLALLCLQISNETPFGTRCTVCLGPEAPPAPRPELPRCVVRRGFVERVELSTVLFRQHARGLFLEQPVREVFLTDVPVHLMGQADHWTVGANGRHAAIEEALFWDLADPKTGWPWPSREAGEAAISRWGVALGRARAGLEGVPCGCDGGVADTGGFAPWGEPITEPCLDCGGSGLVPPPPTVPEEAP